ncbi:unnamed protein product [Arabidopsis lyrata]|uniref:uncharacterized protein LOC9312218 n=1 Tax=Arabidopsis lyrata subsp. lyrata TaxID=81972 RepID=UPI000A29DA45|nr:uncharacterized protein LOC9312218 [Arabidopsis lyrata subsp. lyrata]XP_020879699.1 uncharacterized protein LOC9312218 [Arabidopsis lyrata subsp. lyrata]CAH8268374.1 unnamed protein product [Arabidopsis lyrata]|eukprot:XP_020879698.1 uncharacterized protein LOC9312218 [Arabidopsis lyrata subsp. lyrata]
MATTEENLELLQEIDHRIEEIVLTVPCSAWNENRSSQILDALLFIVKRTFEPRIQIILKPAWPVENFDFCRFHWASDRFEELLEPAEEEPRFLLPRQRKGFVVFFNNLEDSTRARNCIKRLVDPAPTGVIEEQRAAIGEYVERRGPMQEDEQRGRVVAGRNPPSVNDGIPTDRLGPSGVASGTLNPSAHTISFLHDEEQGGSGPSNGTFDQHVYLQNSRVIMAMIAVLLATIVLTVGLNPPSTIDTISVKIIFQITFWIAAVFSLAALFILGMVTPTSFDMQVHRFRCAFVSISVGLICVVVAFVASTVSMTSNLFARIVGGLIGAIGIVVFSYFTSITVRDFIYTKTGFRLTQHADNKPYALTCFSV